MYILITGGFDPVHSGHIKAFRVAERLGKLVIGLNSDEWLVRKKGVSFMTYAERYSVVSNLMCVHSILDSWTDDDGTACDAIRVFHKQFKDRGVPLLFANGGDRTAMQANCQEFDECTALGILSIYGLGGVKTASSSNILKRYADFIMDHNTRSSQADLT
jgi:D-beta-D-heptose 7-phosphate kinase/D-beta-D-heptose 1-phosphate adenosyltransferase